jgi:hypothetical protein
VRPQPGQAGVGSRLGAEKVAVGALLDPARGEGVAHVAHEVLRDGPRGRRPLDIAAESIGQPNSQAPAGGSERSALRAGGALTRGWR